MRVLLLSAEEGQRVPVSPYLGEWGDQIVSCLPGRKDADEKGVIDVYLLLLLRDFK